MARQISGYTVPSIPQPSGYAMLERENRDFSQADIPCNDMVPQFLRRLLDVYLLCGNRNADEDPRHCNRCYIKPCHQRALAVNQDSSILRTRKLSSSVGEGRIFWNAVADLISSSSFFPITINVPDVLSAMGQFITQLPIINRIYLYLTQDSTPRKKKKKKQPLVQGQHDPQPAHSSTSKRRPARAIWVNVKRNRQ